MLILPPRNRLLLTSSREHSDYAFFVRHLRPRFSPETVLVHGACRGGDLLADGIWKSWGGVTEPHPVKKVHWDYYGLGAGPERNRFMVDLGADECVAFPIGKSKGTRGCYDLARDAGIPSKIFEYPDCMCELCTVD